MDEEKDEVEKEEEEQKVEDDEEVSKEEKGRVLGKVRQSDGELVSERMKRGEAVNLLSTITFL